MDVKTIFAARLKELREEAGLSQVQLGEKTGTSRGSISYYENCDRTPDIVFLKKIADFFHVSLDYLLGNCNTKNPENTNIGKELNLTDEAIEIIKEFNTAPCLAGDQSGALNLIIEHHSFPDFFKAVIWTIDMQRPVTNNNSDTGEISIEDMAKMEALSIKRGLTIVPQGVAARAYFNFATDCLDDIIQDIAEREAEKVRRPHDGESYQPEREYFKLITDYMDDLVQYVAELKTNEKFRRLYDGQHHQEDE